MTRTRKWLLGIGIAVVVLIVLFFAALAWIVYTPSGLRFALDRGVGMMHGRLAYANASGTLAGETTINGLRFRDASGDVVQVRHAVVELQPWALLGGGVHIRKARIDGVTVDLAPPQPTQESKPFSLKPPMTIELDDTRIIDIDIRRAGHPVFAADSLALAGLWSANQLKLDTFDLRAPNGHVALQGTLSLAQGYRGQGKVNVNWHYHGKHYVAQLTAHSDGQTAQLRTVLTAPVRLQLDATLGLGQSHSWSMQLHVPRFDPRGLAALPKSIHALAVDLKGAGDAGGGKISGSIVANGHSLRLDPLAFGYHDKVLTLDPLRLRSPGMPGVATATGKIHLDRTPMTVALDVNWKGVQLPADLVGQQLATHGELHVQGSGARFSLKGALAIGSPGRLSKLKLDLAGTPQAIQLNALKLVQKNGGLDVHGSVGLKPEITWKLDAAAKHFDPGAILAGWDGSMDFHLATAGAITPQGPEGTLKLDHADGTLRGRSIAGSKADLRITPRNLLDGTATLVAGHSRIHAAGKPGNRTDAQLSLDIASLGDWIPDASGGLHGGFHIAGVWPALSVRGALRGDKLVVSGNHVDALHLQASIPDISKPGGNLDLTLSGVVASRLTFDEVHLTASGNAQSHQLQLHARGQQLSAALALHGTWKAKTKTWNGTLSGVELAPQGLPAWRQQQPTSITWQRGAVTLSKFCLSSGVPSFCLSGSRTRQGAITLHYALQHLPLQLLATLASGPAPLQASGELSGSGKLAIAANGQIHGHATLNATPGKIAYASNPGQPLLAWSSLGVTATANGTNQHIVLRGALGDGGDIDGDIGIRGGGHALPGTLDADLRSLAFLEALSPEIANVQGTLAGSLQLGGTLAAPRFSGRIQASGFSAEVPRAGLELHDGQFAIAGSPGGRLSLSGQITSGKGVLHIDGSAGIAANAPLSLDIKGENFLVADIPAAHVLASPDLHISRADGVFAVTGTVAIPSAEIKAEKLPGQGPAKASPDIVIVDAPPAKEVAPLAVKADITVTLGKDMKVQGYGFDGTLKGQLAVHVLPGKTATGRGQISVSGKYQAYGQDLTIDNGLLLFAGTRLDNPGLAMRATRHIRSGDVTVGLNIRGTAQHPVLTIFSSPPMQQAEALSYLVTGRPLDQLKSGEGNSLQTAAQALGGLAGSKLAKAIGPRLGLEASVSNSEALGASAFTVGKYLSPRLFLSYGVGLFTPGTVITLRYTINRFLQFEAENVTTGNRAGLDYTIEK